eukprot:CAMPEP_0116143504 /NCGR_PEP_ID=MMETSP0329-20121206/15488_1 /TAXON_ID=697910 /ORGANISM="Pseudo-nitzschia arenysensis, Strain B593" /LENGTH=195 /DNA_ID=CAMNT_0003638833 /DNA_START=149 /DNA_END=736 /DNA_ORIENTATION=-
MNSTNRNRVLQNFLLLVLLTTTGVTLTSGFIITPSPLTKYSLLQQRTHQSGILSQDDSSSRDISCSAFVDSSSIMISEESWRQYVPLIVSVGIIIDILLGNPLANSVLKPMRPEEEGDESQKNEKPRSKARIDAELVAQQALDKANNTLELRRYLDESKTDYDRMEEMKRKLDASMQDLDEDLEARQNEIDERKT